MNSKRSAVYCLLILCCLSGCASQQVMTNTYLASSPVPEPVSAGAAFAVLPNTNVPNPIFDQTVREKIEFMLTDLGYQITEPSQADFLVHFAYDMQGDTRERQIVHTFPRFRGFSVRGANYYDPFWDDGLGYTTYTSDPYTVYIGKLRLQIDRRTNQAGPAESNAVWVGEAFTESYDPDLRNMMNYLLAAEFRYFMKDTGRARTLSLNDEGIVKTLRGISYPAAPAEAPKQPSAAAQTA